MGRTTEQGLSQAMEGSVQRPRLPDGDSREGMPSLLSSSSLIKTLIFSELKLLFYLLQKLPMLLAGNLENTAESQGE